MISLLQKAERPLTLQELQDQMKRNACDFATVFRFMSLLEKGKWVETHHWDDGLVRYEIRHDGHCHHHFLICRQCQAVREIDECTVSQIESHLTQTWGFQEISHKLEFSGICPNCQKGSTKKRS